MLKVVSSSSRRQSSEDRFVPLKDVSVQVNIHAFAAEICIKQVFINSEETSNPIEAVYCFPIEEQAAIYSFEANLDDGRKIQAQIKEKKNAQREYCNALKQGHGAVLLEQDEKSNDIFTISIGSLQPQSKCEIEIRYVQELELIDNGQRIQYILPTTIAPRYSSISAGDGHIKSPGLTQSKYVQSAPYTISFSCLISSLPIASVASPSHPIQVTTQSDNSTTEVSLSQENTHLDRDIILNIDLKQQRILTYTLIEKQAIMVSLVPTLELCDSSNNIGKINCEYIFIVDCSGSMSDENKIGYARQAMSVFLKSLPIGSYFNIFRFGSTYEQFKKEQITIEYNEKSAKEANNYIEDMQADLGGTELYSVLSYLHENAPQTNYSRQIFILTDGEISDVDKVLRLCHSMSNTTRIFSFGLGSSPSRALVKGLARTTNGSYLFIPPKTHVDVAVARQVDKALEPCLVNIKVQCHFNNPELKDYRISPKILPPIHAKQRLNVYIMMPEIIKGTLSGSIEFLTDKNNLLERVTFNETEPSSTLVATRLAAKSIITDLQMDDYNSNTSRQSRFAEQQEADKKKELIDISIQHQILSPFTAFIGVITRTEQEKASSGEMILREVPIEIRDNGSASDSDSSSPNYKCMKFKQSFHCPMIDMDEDGDDCEDELDHLIEKLKSNSSSTLKMASSRFHGLNRTSSSKKRRQLSRSRSRSCSPQRRGSSSSSKDQHENDIRDNGSAWDSNSSSLNYLRMQNRQIYLQHRRDKDRYEQELYSEKKMMILSPTLKMASSRFHGLNRTSSSEKRCRQLSRSPSRSRSPQRSRSRSRSHSPQRRRSSSSSKDQHKNDSTSDIIREIISLQNFNGLWSIINLEQIISSLQNITVLKNIDLKGILNDYKDNDNDIILSMIIMFIFMKYLTADQSLWKPIMKKCAKTMEDQLGKNEYNTITDKIRQAV